MGSPGKTTISIVVSSILLVIVCLSPDGTETACANEVHEKILVSISDSLGLDDTLYTLNPDGTGLTALFSFHDQPVIATGRIYHPRVSSDGRSIYFSSDHAYVYTPLSRNLFRIAWDGTGLDQITPGPNSGKWNQPCPCGVVQGTVRNSNGDPLSSSPVYLEGMSFVHSGADGSFRFDNVPEGKRYITAHRPGDSSVFASQEIFVTSLTPVTVDLIPDTSLRLTCKSPAVYGERIYFQLGFNSIQWTDATPSPFQEVYQTSGTCTLPDVDGFDVGPASGTLAIVDYADGCTTNRGVYLMDRDGQNATVFLDMKAGSDWCGGGEIFWSPDEKRLALKACYTVNFAWHTWLLVYSAETGELLGSTYFTDSSYTLFNVALHGWSPDGNRLLYSYFTNQTSDGILCKIKVNTDGSLDSSSVVTLLSNETISGATWGVLDGSSTAGPLAVKRGV